MRRHFWMIVIFVLLGVLLALEVWTYYLGRPNVTFERYTHLEAPASIELGLRRYRAAHSPHLFSFPKNAEGEALVEKLIDALRLQKVDASALPDFLPQVDVEMTEVMRRSKPLYLSKRYDIDNFKRGRLYVLFSDDTKYYLYLNGDL